MSPLVQHRTAGPCSCLACDAAAYVVPARRAPKARVGYRERRAARAARPAPESQMRLRVLRGIVPGSGPRLACAHKSECLSTFIRAHGDRQGECVRGCRDHQAPDRWDLLVVASTRARDGRADYPSSEEDAVLTRGPASDSATTPDRKVHKPRADKPAPEAP